MLGESVEVVLDDGPSTGHRGLDDRRLHRHSAADPARGGDQRWRSSAPVLEDLGTELGAEPSRARRRPGRSTRRSARTVREYLLVFLVAGVASYLLCVFARELAIRSGAVARVRDRDVHATPIPYFGGVAMLGGLGAGLLVARHLPFLSTSQPIVFHDSGIVLIAGRDDLRGRRGRRPDRARRPDQARRPDRRRGLPGAQRRAALVAEAPRRRPVRARPDPGRAADDAAGGQHDERGELRRRPRRPGRRRGADRRGRVLPVLLPARRRQRGDARDHRGHALRGAGRRLRRLPATQLLPGPHLHGRLRLDAARPGALRVGADPHRAVRDRLGGAGRRRAAGS